MNIKSYLDQIRPREPMEIQVYDFKKLGYRVLDHLEKQIPGMELTVENKKVIKQLAYYFSNDKRFNNPKDQYGLKKGIYLFGDVGVGKSTLMESFRKAALEFSIPNPKLNEDIRFMSYNWREISEKIRNNVPGVIEAYSNSKLNSGAKNYPRNYYFDEFKSTPKLQTYGSAVDLIDILLNRYNHFQTHGIKTHLSTNLSPHDLVGFMPKELLSRMEEMFNFIRMDSFQGKDYRIGV